MRFHAVLLLLLLAIGTQAAAGAAPVADAGFILLADQHSAYERTAQIVAAVDAIRAANQQVPLAILIDGDVFEYGNAIARRSHGTLDFAMLAALAQRAPTVLNIGNHDPEFFAMAETVRRIEETGVRVISDAVDSATGRPFAPASCRLRLGRTDFLIAGVTTNHLATFRPAVRAQLEVPDPAAWGRATLPRLLAGDAQSIVLSHAGLQADRMLLPLVPDGTLFVGAHDHLRLVHRVQHTVYVHSGSWNEWLTVAWLRRNRATEWTVDQHPVAATDPADPALARRIRATDAQYGAATDAVIVGHTTRAYSTTEAERFVAAAVRTAAQADAAFIGHTTFGGGLPAGAVTRLAFDACVRFDGPIFVGEVDGAHLRRLLATANQTFATPWAERGGEYLAAAGPAEIVPARVYRVAVSDWIARNPAAFLGIVPAHLTERPLLRLKAIAAAALNDRAVDIPADP